MTEEWRPVVGYEGLYEVSSLCAVRGVRRRGTAGGRLSPQAHGVGHLWVQLWRGNRRCARSIHTLLLEAFIGPRPLGHESRHLDGDPTNNHISNLLWGSRSENVLDRVEHGTHHYASRSHCKHGHPYSPDNTRWIGNTRICRTCRRVISRASAARRAP